MMPMRMEDRTEDRMDMAQIAVSAFVQASLACMENPQPGSLEETKCERLIARARQYEMHYARQLRKQLTVRLIRDETRIELEIVPT